MTKRLLLSLLAFSTFFGAGCNFLRKEKKQKESSAIASEVEKEFRQRWISKRVTELAAQGTTGPAAQAQAEQEFTTKFAFSRDKR